MRKRRNGGRPTIADVAQRAGVSSITVSRALRDPERVSPQLRQQIEEAVRELEYVPDQHARALASARTDVIGVIIPSFTNNVFADVLRGIYDGLAQTPYQVQLGNSRYSPIEEERLLATFLSQRPAALIVAGIDQTERGRALLAAAGCPVVQVMDLGDDPVDMMVGFSHRASGHAVTSHLLEAGYRRIGFLGARMDPRTQRRLEGYRAALAEAGLYDPARITTTPASSSVSLGRDLLRDLLARMPDTDAVFCNNDDLALGALFECQRALLAVPASMGIAGFNDLEMMAAACPSLTSVRTPRYEIGSRAVQMARAAIAGRRPAERVVDTGFALQIRESTKRPETVRPQPMGALYNNA
ncbi:LacI family DNA-binding transcriptional regulator [Ancylobacter sonchi]|uniref:LacI family DNA-binding transcriptional regulator n=1 Tax=Ancylobacter sonchi TaxID=1937790 RepID=UPI001FEB31FA|nr:LacI family DNA-binding transcriptional regulator [Ancylobacter sonchi]